MPLRLLLGLPWHPPGAPANGNAAFLEDTRAKPQSAAKVTTMHFPRLQYFPLSSPFLLALFLLLAIVIALVELRILSYAYEKIGIGHRYVWGLLLLSLLGSYINIPVAELPPEELISNEEVRVGVVQYVIPHAEDQPGTIVAINVGGALIPTLLSLYLLVKHRLFWNGLLGVAIVTLIVHQLANPVRGVGISVPTVIPPLVAAGVALLLSRQAPPALAYTAGSLGTLIGADLLNLNKVQGLGAPVASIGGAGTFDGIFVTGILAVLLAPVGRRPRTAPAWQEVDPATPADRGPEDRSRPVFS
jgi:uncharacterized membrane protein